MKQKWVAIMGSNRVLRSFCYRYCSNVELELSSLCVLVTDNQAPVPKKAVSLYGALLMDSKVILGSFTACAVSHFQLVLVRHSPSHAILYFAFIDT